MCDRSAATQAVARPTPPKRDNLAKGHRPDLMGYSLGGGLTLQTAIRHPDVVGKLVLVSAPFRRDGFCLDILA
jgi:pimeloyl-ACP methyl ester carboxylesterase